MRYFELTGQDNFFFRDGRTFEKGNDVKARSIFPPLPLVLRGILRTAYFSKHMEYFPCAGQEGDPTEQIHIKCLLLKCQMPTLNSQDNVPKYQDAVLVPVPYSMYLEKQEDKWVAKLLTVLPANQFSSHPLPQYLAAPDELGEIAEVSGDDYMRLDDLLGLMSNTIESASVIKLSKVMLKEVKTGITIDAQTGRSAEHMLYQTELLYPYDEHNNPIRILLAVEGVSDKEMCGFVKAGGGGKTAYLKHTDNFLQPFKAIKLEHPYFAVILLSPAIFGNGWMPGFVNEYTLVGQIGDAQVKLITAAVGRSVPISGFDVKLRKAKPLYHAAPAGSVYIFEVIAGDREAAGAFFHMKNISDKWKEEGLGYAIVVPIEKL